LLAARHLKFTAQATLPAVAARQVPTQSALPQALVVHQAVALPIRVVAAKRLQQDLLLLPVVNHLLVLARIAQAQQQRKRSLVSHKQAAARIFLFFQPNRVNSIRYEKNQSS